MFWLDSFSRIDEMHGVVDGGWGLTKACGDEVDLAIIEAAVSNSIDTRYGRFLLLVDNDTVALEVQAPLF